MKKFMAIVLVIAMIFSFSACKDTTKDEGEKTFTDELQNTEKIVIGVSPDYEPYEYYDEAGNITGFDIEALEKICEIINEQNGTNLTLEWVPMTFSTIVSAVQAKQVDIGVSCFTYDPERDVLFSDYYLKSAQVAVVPADSDIATLDDLKNKNIGAGTGTTGEEAAMAIEGANVTSPGDYVVMFEILKNGGLDAVVSDEAVALNYASTGDYKVLEEKLVDEEVSIITENGNTALLDTLNAAIAEFIASDSYEELKTKYGLN